MEECGIRILPSVSIQLIDSVVINQMDELVDLAKRLLVAAGVQNFLIQVIPLADPALFPESVSDGTHDPVDIPGLLHGCEVNRRLSHSFPPKSRILLSITKYYNKAFPISDYSIRKKVTLYNISHNYDNSNISCFIIIGCTLDVYAFHPRILPRDFMAVTCDFLPYSYNTDNWMIFMVRNKQNN